MIKKLIFVLTAIALVSGVIAFSSCSQGEKKEDTKKTQTQEPIYIGFAGPLSGDQSQFGVDIARGVEIAVDEINQKGGLLGRKVELIKLDDKADPREASNAAAKLVANEKVVGVVGHLNSGCSIPASISYNRANMLMISPSSTADDVTNRGLENVFRVVFKDSKQGPAAAVFAKEKLGANAIAVLNDKTAYGKGLAEAFKNKAIELGMNIVAEDAYSVGEKDFSTLVTKLMSANPDVVYVGSMYAEAALLLKQARPRGLKAILMGGDGLFAPKLIEIAGDAAEGIVISFMAPPWEETETASNFLKTYKEKYKEDVKSFAPLAYNAMMALAEGIKRAGAAERGAIIKAMHAPDFQLEAIGGTIKFDKNGDIEGRQPYFYTVKNGKFVLYGSEEEKTATGTTEENNPKESEKPASPMEGGK